MKFKTNNEVLKVISDEVILKLDVVFDDLNAMRELAAMKFDARWTKPASLTGLRILSLMRGAQGEVRLHTYTQNFFKWKVAPVNGYTTLSRMNEVFFNTRQLSRRIPFGDNSTEETLWHELVHIVDAHAIERFDHGDNKLKGKDESAPVKFAKFMASYKTSKGV